MLRGPSTVSFYASDLSAAKAWYTEVLGIEPYFDTPGYIEFRIGDHQTELGIIDSAYAGSELSRTTAPDPDHPRGTVLFWHVDAITQNLDRLIELGARELDPRSNRTGSRTEAPVEVGTSVHVAADDRGAVGNEGLQRQVLSVGVGLRSLRDLDGIDHQSRSAGGHGLG